MKTLNHLLLLLLLFLSACTSESTKSLLAIEELSKTYPDSALHVLEKDAYPYSMDDKNVAKWCMLNLSLRDSLQQSLDVDTLLLERMMKYYKETGQTQILPQAGLYYGRTLALNKSHEKAIRTYLEALEDAESNKDYNLAGYVSSYIADLYYEEYESELAREYYLKAEQYFSNVKNKRSQVIAYRDISYTFSLDEKYNDALMWLLKADSMSVSMNDSVLRSSLFNYLGNAYMKMGHTDLAETYFLNSISLFKETRSANYLSLIDVYIASKQYDMAYKYLNLTDSLQLEIEDKNTLYKKYYLIEKSRDNIALALRYLELNTACTDSVWKENHSKELVEIKQKYAQEHLININNELKIKEQKNIIILIALSLIVMALLTFVCFLVSHRKLLNQKIKLGLKETEREHLEAENKAIALAAKEKEYKELEKRSEIIKNFLFERTLIYEKMKILSELPANSEKREVEFSRIIKEMFDEPFLTTKDWKVIKDYIDGVCPSYATSLMVNELLSEDELDYCYLVRFGFSNDKVIIVLNITKATLKSKRHRIMKKLELTNQNVKLEDYLASLSKKN